LQTRERGHILKTPNFGDGTHNNIRLASMKPKLNAINDLAIPRSGWIVNRVFTLSSLLSIRYEIRSILHSPLAMLLITNGLALHSTALVLILKDLGSQAQSHVTAPSGRRAP